MAPLTDLNPYGKGQTGVWFNHIHTFEVETEGDGPNVTAHFPKSCLHCEEAACVTVCPTGASYKREEDGIVLVEDAYSSLLCSWACRAGARIRHRRRRDEEYTLCIDRIWQKHGRGRPGAGLRLHLPGQRARRLPAI